MRTLTLFMAALVSVLGLSFAAQADPTIDLLFGGVGGTDSINVSVNDTITVDVVITLPGTDATAGYQFTVGWDPSELSFVTGSLNNILWNVNWVVSGFGEYFNTGYSLPGSISAFGAPSMFPGNTPVSIGQLQFVVQAGAANDGTGDITAFFDQAHTFTTDNIDNNSAAGYTAVTFNGAGVNVIPEPTTASLLGLGLLGLTVAGRRRR